MVEGHQSQENAAPEDDGDAQTNEVIEGQVTDKPLDDDMKQVIEEHNHMEEDDDEHKNKSSTTNFVAGSNKQKTKAKHARSINTSTSR